MSSSAITCGGRSGSQNGPHDETSSFPYRDKVRRLTSLGAVGVTTATVLVAEVFHRSFDTRRHLPAFRLAASPYASGDSNRDRGNKRRDQARAQSLSSSLGSWLRYRRTQARPLVARAVRKYGYARQEGWHRLSGPQTGFRLVAVRRAGCRTGRRDAQGLIRRDRNSRACR